FIGDEAGRGSGRFEYTRGWTVSITGHTLPADVQDRARSAVEGIVVASVDVADVPYGVRQTAILPASAAQHESGARTIRGSPKKELVAPRSPVRQAIAEKTQLSFEAGVAGGREMRARIQGVIDGNASSGAARLVRPNHGVTAAISEDQVVLRNVRGEGIIRIPVHAVESSR